MPDIDVCAGCLATNVRMHSMSDSGLLQTYQLLSGRQRVQIGEVILQKLCWECSALVSKAETFRYKCERAYLLLQYIYSAHNESPQYRIPEIDRSQNGLTSPCTLSEIAVFSTPDGNSGSNGMLENVNRNESIINFEQFDLGEPKISVPEPFVDVKSEDEVDTQEPVIDLQDHDSDDFDEAVTETRSSKSLNRDINRRETSHKAVKNGKQKKGKANSKTTSTNLNAVAILLSPSPQYRIPEIDRSQNGLTSPCTLSEIAVFSTPDGNSGSNGMLENVNRNESIINFEQFDLGEPKISVPEPFVDVKSEDEVDTQEPVIDLQDHDSDDFDEAVTETRSSKSLNRDINRRETSHKAVKNGKQKKGKANSKTTSTNLNAVAILLSPCVTEIPMITAEQGVSHNTATIKEELDQVNDLRKEPSHFEAIFISTLDGSADFVEDVCSQDAAAMKQELDIGLTVLQPSDLHYKRGKAADTTPLTNSIETHRLHCSHLSAVGKYESCSDLSLEKTTGKPDAAAETEHGCSNTYSKYVHETSHASDRSESVDVCTEPLLIKSVVKNLKKRIGESMFVCKVCDKHFTRRNHLTMHSKTHTANLCCDICGKLFTTKPNLRRHRTIHASERPYSCDVCSKRYALNRSLTQHKKTHASVRPYGCDTCGRYFIRKTRLRLHLIVHNYERPYSWGVCSKGIQVKANLKRYERKHNDQSYKCDICSEFFTKESFLLKHMSCHDERRPYSCEICSKRFKQKITLKNHMAIHTVERPYSCDICKSSFKLKRTLIFHIRNHNDARGHSCNFCSKTFKNNWTLIKHIKRIHPNERPYGCVDCGKDFTQYCDLKVHKKIHAEKRLYRCDVCDTHFNQENKLINHKRYHNGERPYSCVVCNKSFAQKLHLTKHEKIHNEVFSYNCDVCSKSFLRKDGLKNHKMLHTGERPYCCNVCGKGLRTRGQLTQHEIIHSTDRPYTCDVCGKRFALKHYLKAHQEFHADIRPYKCDVCSKRFRRPFNLKEHMRTHPS